MFLKKAIFEGTATENYILGGLQTETLAPVKEEKKRGVGCPTRKQNGNRTSTHHLKHTIINKMNLLIVSFYQ